MSYPVEETDLIDKYLRLALAQAEHSDIYEVYREQTGFHPSRATFQEQVETNTENLGARDTATRTNYAKKNCGGAVPPAPVRVLVRDGVKLPEPETYDPTAAIEEKHGIRPNQFIDLTDRQFGDLTILRRAQKRGFTAWVAYCALCGQTVTVRSVSVRNGQKACAQCARARKGADRGRPRAIPVCSRKQRSARCNGGGGEVPTEACGVTGRQKEAIGATVEATP